MTSAALDATEVDALQTDRYLEALLAGRRATAPTTCRPTRPSTRRFAGAARRLRDELVRVHPSFRFEERLARRLADAAAGCACGRGGGRRGHRHPVPGAAPRRRRPGRRAGEPRAGRAPRGAATMPAGRSAAFPGPGPRGRRFARPAARRACRRPFAGPAPARGQRARRLAALSLAGAAFVAWRLTAAAPQPGRRRVRARGGSPAAPRPTRWRGPRASPARPAPAATLRPGRLS